MSLRVLSVSSSLHASIVTILSIVSLVFDRTQWFEPIVTVSRTGCIALAITVGYMLADIITMVAFQKGLQLYLFTVHHIVVAVCFTFLLAYRIALVYAIIRLTCEISTPFLNQRWFYWTMGGKGSDRKAAIATLIFAALFVLGRYILPIPYWYFFFAVFNSEVHLVLKPYFPPLTNHFISCPVLLDLLNILWGFPICGVAKKALITLGYVEAPKAMKNEISTGNGSVAHRLGGSVAPNQNGSVAPKQNGSVVPASKEKVHEQ
ncbi:unnamed protein product [Hymenolepis diminuta]|uniref:TLC domain-containing protein n=1 Tax=Hymenolepis diminuta TaxID=6216 RepID=A0A564YPH2_HYMDI|nr:unnamed protein product [Hymenolepis diminuta]